MNGSVLRKILPEKMWDTWNYQGIVFRIWLDNLNTSVGGGGLDSIMQKFPEVKFFLNLLFVPFILLNQESKVYL